MTYFYQKKQLAGFAGLAMLLLVAGCKKETAPVTNYLGQVIIYDDLGAPVKDASGVKVSLYGSPDVTTQTTADGHFTLQAPAAGAQRLVFEGSGLGTYYSNKLTATGSEYVFSKPVKLGQWSPVSYEYSIKADNVRRQIVVTGTMFSFSPIAAGPRTHRLFLQPGIGDDGYIDARYYLYSLLRKNNRATGFSDTIAYSVLEAVEGRKAGTSFLSAHSDNPVADSCQAPAQGGVQWYGKTFPAIGFRGLPVPSSGNGPAIFVWGR